ncbi:MAG: NUDIX domain-containing protein [Candidatus Altiarchaeota archaeon]|nr:NUDIX domain-containing protein [Candidatus Altiarchaeota archaeon]
MKNTEHLGDEMPAPNYEQKHFTVTVYIVDENQQVLLINHPKLKVWLPPGGHLEPNELPTDGAVREVFEEVGLKISLPSTDLKDATLLKNPDYLLVEDLHNHNHIDMIYVVRVKHFEPKHEFEISEHRWVKESELDDLKMPYNARFLAKDALKKF